MSLSVSNSPIFHPRVSSFCASMVMGKESSSSNVSMEDDSESLIGPLKRMHLGVRSFHFIPNMAKAKPIMKWQKKKRGIKKAPPPLSPPDGAIILDPFNFTPRQLELALESSSVVYFKNTTQL